MNPQAAVGAPASEPTIGHLVWMATERAKRFTGGVRDWRAAYIAGFLAGYRLGQTKGKIDGD